MVGFEPGKDGCSFTVRHRVEGAPLINDVIAEGLAQFVCTVASPLSSYRTSHVSSEARQEIRWDSDDLGEPPMFTPMVVVSAPFQRKLDRQQHGVHDLWHGRTVEFELGTRLALSDVVLMRSSVLNMLLFELDAELSDGEFRVEAEDREGFRFHVHLAADLHRFLKHDSDDVRHRHIITHVVGACFGVLKSDYRDDEDEEGGWQSFRGLVALADMLKAKGLPHWSDDDFAPELAATRLYPHAVDGQPSGGNGED